MTVDRMARFIKIATLGLVAAMLVFLAIIFLFIGGFRIVGELVGDMELAYAIVGGVFLLLGALLWFARTSRREETE